MADRDAKKAKQEGDGNNNGTGGNASEVSEEELAASVNELKEVQEELDKVNEKAGEEVMAIEQKYNVLRRPIFDKRNSIISTIPDFWATVFISHPALCAVLTEEDHEVLEHLKALDVQCDDVKAGYTITFTFGENPYFDNTELKKVYTFKGDGMMQMTGTKIDWKPGKDITKKPEGDGKKKGAKKRALEHPESFFTWFTVEDDEQMIEGGIADDLGEIIKEDVWADPLKYYTQEGVEADDGDDDEDDDDDDDDDDDGEDDDDGGEEGEDGEDGEGDGEGEDA